MLNVLIRYRTEIGWVLSVLAATVSVVIFQNVLGFGWFVSIAVGVLAFVSMPILLARYINAPADHHPRR